MECLTYLCKRNKTDTKESEMEQTSEMSEEAGIGQRRKIMFDSFRLIWATDIKRDTLIKIKEYLAVQKLSIDHRFLFNCPQIRQNV